MAKKSAIAKNKQRIKLVEKYEDRRRKLKEKMRLETGEKRMQLQMELASLPVNSTPCRVRNRCSLTGRPRGVYNKFKLSRNMLRHYAMFGEIPGVVKSSW